MEMWLHRLEYWTVHGDVATQGGVLEGAWRCGCIGLSIGRYMEMWMHRLEYWTVHGDVDA
jgi:hypothetical protein